MMARLVLVALVQQPAAPPADSGGRPCVVVVDSIGRNYQEVTVRPGEKNSFAGGGVLAHCQATGSKLAADSIALYGGVNRFDMLGNVHIRDTALTLDAANASYFLRQERLDAHKNVVATNRVTGSVLRGPNLTYYRAVKGIRDTMEMYASSHPTIDYRSSPDSGEPYVIVADRVRFKGNDRMWGGGGVTIDRSDMGAIGDSMQLDEGAGFGLLLGEPRVEGKGPHAYTLVGTRIEFGLHNREIRRVKALGQGFASGSDWRLTADTIHLALEQRKLQQAFAWSTTDTTKKRTDTTTSRTGPTKSRTDPPKSVTDTTKSITDTTKLAKAVSTLNTIEADSLALDTPGEVLTEARAFRHAFSTSKKDSSANAEVNWIAGDSLTAHWVQVADSAGRSKATLQRLDARGAARALSHIHSEKDSAGPAIDYSRGQRIDIALRGDRIDRVVVTGRADGVHLEPLPPKPVATDSTAKTPSDSTARKPTNRTGKKPASGSAKKPSTP